MHMCHVCVFSLHGESPDMILGDKLLLFQGGGGLSQLVLEQDRGKTHTKASKNYNNVVGE
jgi:hypothetical protein